jgi:hypothetical protein
LTTGKLNLRDQPLAVAVRRREEELIAAVAEKRRGEAPPAAEKRLGPPRRNQAAPLHPGLSQQNGLNRPHRDPRNDALPTIRQETGMRYSNKSSYFPRSQRAPLLLCEQIFGDFPYLALMYVILPMKT